MIAGQISSCNLRGAIGIAEGTKRVTTVVATDADHDAITYGITGGADAASYQPMNVNFGLFPPVAEDVRKKDRKLAYTQRAGAALAEWMKVADGVAA